MFHLVFRYLIIQLYVMHFLIQVRLNSSSLIWLEYVVDISNDVGMPKNIGFISIQILYLINSHVETMKSIDVNHHLQDNCLVHPTHCIRQYHSTTGIIPLSSTYPTYLATKSRICIQWVSMHRLYNVGFCSNVKGRVKNYVTSPRVVLYTPSMPA